MTEHDATDPQTPEDASPPDAKDGWHALPRAARNLFMASGLFFGLPFAIGGSVLGGSDRFAPLHWWQVGVLAGLAGAGFGAWLGWRRYRHTFWRLDADGFSRRRGRMWFSEVRVPVNRVQHLDLRRGPLERRWGLATLVVHTAGTRESSVTVGGLASDDAERLRDLLARQVEHDRNGIDDDEGPAAAAPVHPGPVA